MNPNMYVAEELARQREAKVARRASEAWKYPPEPRSLLGERARVLMLMLMLFSCGVVWLLA